MAKNQAAAAEGQETTAATETKAPKAPRNQAIKYVFQKERTEGQKFAPQAILILEHIQNAGADGITRGDLKTKLDADDRFKTKQPAERIVSYYQKDLENAGLISVSK
jgi:hypothetical protein